MTTVFIVDDHEVVREGVAAMIRQEPDLDVVGAAGTLLAARHRIGATRPQVVVLDVRLPDGDGIDLCRELRAEFPQLHCLIFSAFDDLATRAAAIEAGASGYVLKDIRGAQLVRSIRAVSGKPPTTAQALGSDELAAASDQRAASLTARERQVLELIAEGCTNREIGAQLHLAEKTIKNYVSSLFDKLGLQHRTQAAMFFADRRDR